MSTITDPPTASTTSREIPGDASAAAFPLGGIGTGNVSLGARGELRDWEIFNAPAKGNKLPYTFFALHAAPEGGVPVTKVLEARLRPPHESWTGYDPGDLAGVPRLHDSSLRGEYPFAWIDFVDDELPVSVTLEAFTPLIPLDAAESGLPVAILRYRARNTTNASVAVTVVGSLFNPIGFETDATFGVPTFAGTPRSEFRSEARLRGVLFGSSLTEDDLRYGTVALLTASPSATARHDWPASSEGVADFWEDLCADGRLEDRVIEDLAQDVSWANDEWRDLLAERGKARAGSLGIVQTLAPDEERTFEFLLAWHFPNRPRTWPGAVMLPPAHPDEIVRNFYATRFADAWEVARHVQEQLPVLEEQTRAFHDSLWNSSLPSEVVDAAASNIASLRSTTCFRLENGTFAGWEGTLDRRGSCEGSCTHVWNYAQTAAFLFPELERSMRRVEFGLETEPDGRMNFRTNGIFDGKPWMSPPAVDGQLGTIIRFYREWKLSGDDAFLAELWPNVVKALEFAFDHWDSDGDLVLDGRQHNTYDIDFYGPNPLANVLFYAALRAAAEIAGHLGDVERAERYRGAAERGAATMDELLWNGEYYIQRLDDVNAHPYQHGTGCLSDQLLGQLLARVAGLGYVLPAEHVKQALASIHRYNFRPSLRGQQNFLRTYALEDEGGLLLCSWPNGDRPRRAFGYSDEVWTGVEYQVAAHLIYEGLVDEGLEIVRAVRARHDGYRRSPWNEAECGNHYARSLASWAVLLAYSGYSYDATKQAIGFAPAATDGDFRCFFSTGTGWGTFRQDAGSAQLELRHGSLRLSRLQLRPPHLSIAREAKVNGHPLFAQIETREDGTGLTFETVVLGPGDILGVEYAITR